MRFLKTQTEILINSKKGALFFPVSHPQFKDL